MIVKFHNLQDQIESYYEDYIDGKITLEEREKLISEAKQEKYMESVMKDFHPSYFSSQIEKFNEVKSYLYNECADGRITENEREDLIVHFMKEYVLRKN